MSATSTSSGTVSGDALLQQLRWRYAVKQFDPNRKISERDWAVLEQALVLSPSSYGLQPWQFVLVQDSGLREKLVAASWGQRQVVDASHMVVFAVRSPVNTEHVQKYINRVAEVRSAPVESLEQFKQMLNNAVSNGPEEWHAKQVYIALGNFMTSAAMLGIDTCPMEGLDPRKYDEILGLNKLGLKTLAACPAGYRAVTDKYATSPKVRFATEDVILKI